MPLIMTKIAIVVHRTAVDTKVVFSGTNDEALKFFRAFDESGETSLFYCRSAERTKKTALAVTVTEPVKPVRKQKTDGLL